MYNVYGTKTKPTSDNLFYILFLCSLILLEDCVARNAHHHAIAISYCSCVCYADAKNGVVQDNFSTANNIPFDAVKWRLWLIERVFLRWILWHLCIVRYRKRTITLLRVHVLYSISHFQARVYGILTLQIHFLFRLMCRKWLMIFCEKIE